ncbi:Hypothetical protein UVM_LOCUS193 [uncultured virus]|nr:Hypothetical protein UVM_LOCUS193 [uncultured virus]
MQGERVLIELCRNAALPLLRYLSRIDVIRLQRIGRRVRRSVNETDYWHREAAPMRHCDRALYSASGLSVVATTLDRLLALESMVVGVWAQADEMLRVRVCRKVHPPTWKQLFQKMDIAREEGFGFCDSEDSPLGEDAADEHRADLQRFLWACFSSRYGPELLVSYFRIAVANAVRGNVADVVGNAWYHTLEKSGFLLIKPTAVPPTLPYEETGPCDELRCLPFDHVHQHVVYGKALRWDETVACAVLFDRHDGVHDWTGHRERASCRARALQRDNFWYS